jgi:hypothetical protein
MAILTTVASPDRQALGAGRYLPVWTWKVAALGALAIWLFVVGAHHEPWLDESQAWLIARDSSLRQLLVERVRYEGTPGLWHLLLWLCIRLGLPFAGLYLVSVTCALVGAALLLWCAPFPGPLRALLVASYFGAYQYAVVARSYALDLVLLPALASLFACRTKRPIPYGILVGLLANCNAHSFLLAGVLGAEFLLALVYAGRVRAGLAGLAFAAVLGVSALAVAWQPADNAFLDDHGMRMPPLPAGFLFLQDALVDRWAFWSAQRPPFPGVSFSLLLMLPSILLFRRAGTLPLMAALIAVLIGFSALTYSHPWHSGILFLVWIFGLWISWSALGASPTLRNAVIAALAITGVAQATQAARTGIWDIGHPYSGAAQAARTIAGWRAEHPHASIAIAGFKAMAVQPYFSANIFANYQGGAPQPSYIVWKRGEAWRPFATLAEARAAVAGGYDLLLLSTDGIAPDDLVQFERMAGGQGYRVIAAYPDSLEWKGYAFDDDKLILLARADEVIK